MNRLALSQRIKGLSEAFASESPIGQDLSAMAYVLENMSEEKFASVLNKEYSADKEANIYGAPGQGGSSVINARVQKALDTLKSFNLNEKEKESLFEVFLPKEGTPAVPMMTPSTAPANLPKLASEEGDIEMYWNKEASEAVQSYLLKDVVGMDKAVCCDTGRTLEKEQIPDAEKKQEKPATLTEEQTPKLSESLDSGIVEEAAKAKPVNKEAGEAPKCKVCGKPFIGKKGETCTCKKDKKEDKKEATEEESMINSDGIELTAPMSDVKLSSEDEDQLSKLFE